ncbi:7,8-didemethyl-8-hydroxy-5-deazariboflavin synthase subunit CofH [Noviherbaspirillum sedimenti]|uniref:FO synthase n=2 Tax=Noviherbaspirillum sedimenti TaxID=2320865 RepID=A0A3A3G3L9_9BURK|nr:7,8-didemethyl-8-hydroxy-5-deazariboflavin synthase subunit CofH [Noviherbaspirillum sedimenti]
MINECMEQLAARKLPTRESVLRLAGCEDTKALCTAAAQIRDRGYGSHVTYSRKVFIPLTQLCRDVCHYCTFAHSPKRVSSPYMSIEQVLNVARAGARMGCKEALFTLGDKPELRYAAARDALAELGFASTLEYLAHAARAVLEEVGLLPHINAGCMGDDEIAMLRNVSASMGLMLESGSERLCAKGMPHYGSPDKVPRVRLDTIERAGRARIPFTSGLLIGIGETRLERVESLLALRELHERHGHIQEIIIQPFRAKEGTQMAHAPEPTLEELQWSIAVARLAFGPEMSIQSPPNLAADTLGEVIDAGINDWGGVSPLTPDFVNPEAPWPEVERLARETAAAGKKLHERLTVYPRYGSSAADWIAAPLRGALLKLSDAEGYPRVDSWSPGQPMSASTSEHLALTKPTNRTQVSHELRDIVAAAREGSELSHEQIVQLFSARDDNLAFVCESADELRRAVVGDTVTYTVNRNINYTNVCYFRCQFCAFSKGKHSENLRGKPYDLPMEEIARRAREAWERGATEVCMQGGIHPSYTGQTYLNILRAVKECVPHIHVHAFSPLEVWQGAKTLGITLREFLIELKQAGLGTLPGTAAEILDDEVRQHLCPDKIRTDEWLEVMATAHDLGLKTTSTIMFGHIDRPEHWARHLLHIRKLAARSGGFTEFVPLPFVPMEAPMSLKGRARPGPTIREVLLMHAVARLALHPHIPNIQTSWAKLGKQGVLSMLQAGANDLGGTLMNESITRAAGSVHGQELAPNEMEELIRAAGRIPRQRTTLYGDPSDERVRASFAARPLEPLADTPLASHARPAKRVLVRHVVTTAPECPSSARTLPQAADTSPASID